MFAPHREDDEFFESAIRNYLNAHFGLTNFTVTRRETGAIPLGRLPVSGGHFTGLGGNGGAIRPSSGYAFTFIQKQVARAVANARNGAKPIIVRSPHKAIDLLMDEVFVTVLRRWPSSAPALFLRMASALTGDEFALFLSGEASWALRIKVILAMPKWLFIKAALYCLVGSPKVSVAGAAR